MPRVDDGLVIVGLMPSVAPSDELPSSTDKEKEFKKKVEAATELGLKWIVETQAARRPLGSQRRPISRRP